MQAEIDDLVCAGIQSDAERIKRLELYLGQALIWLRHPDVVEATSRCIGSPKALADVIAKELGAQQPAMRFAFPGAAA